MGLVMFVFVIEAAGTHSWIGVGHRSPHRICNQDADVVRRFADRVMANVRSGQSSGSACGLTAFRSPLGWQPAATLA